MSSEQLKSIVWNIQCIQNKISSFSNYYFINNENLYEDVLVEAYNIIKDYSEMKDQLEVGKKTLEIEILN